MRKFLVLIVTLGLALGCGDDGTSTGPVVDTVTPADASGGDVAVQDTHGDLHDDVVGPHPDVEHPGDEGVIHDVPHAEDTHPDLPPPPQDVNPPEDVGPPAALPLFRVDALAVLSPALCYTFPGSTDCTVLTAAVNAIVDDTLKDDLDPTDVVFQFNTAVPLAGTTTVVLGAGKCPRDAKGEIVSCEVDDDPLAPPATFADAKVNADVPCVTTPLVEAPCFVTPVKDGVVLSVAGLQIGMTSTLAAGRFHGTNPKLEIVGGHLEGFLPKATAATLKFEFPDGTTVALSELLASAPLETKGGLQGWTLQFSFTASQQPAP